jgi:Zn-finger nucleic acid-binding protein
MSYADYYTCPRCGCSLDPGEHCDCMEREKEARNAKNKDTARDHTGADQQEALPNAR